MLSRLVLTLAALSMAGPLLAQTPDTRAEQAEQQRADKAEHLQPATPGKVEAGLFTFEDRYLAERIFNPPRGFFVRAGGMSEGQAIKAGPAYRWSTYDVSFTATSVISVRRAWEVTTRLDFPRPTLTPPPKFISFGALYHSMPQEDFWGFGIDTSDDARTNYLLDERIIDVTGGVNPTKWFGLSGAAEFRTEQPGRGRDPNFPSTGSVFTDDEAPGLDEDLDYLRLGGQIGIDLREAHESTLVGGWYNLSFNRYFDQTSDSFSFNRLDVDLQQYIPIRTSSRLIALRAHATSVVPDDGNVVPVYMQPTIGGSHSVRAYRVSRFRDANSLLLQAEYRFELNAFMAGSLFYDAGTVAAERRDLNLHEMKNDWGFGVRFGFLNLVGMRAEIVFGGETGTVYALRFGDVF